jgi:hypothetical protein
MKSLKSATVILAAAMLAGCSMYRVSYSVDPQTDFSPFQTFSFYSDEITDSLVESQIGEFGVGAARLDSALKSSIQKQLQSKGFTPGAPDSADIWVNYQTISESAIADRYQYRLEDMNQSYSRKQIRYSSSLDASRRFPAIYEQGSIIVDVIARNELQVVWRGVVEIPMGAHNTENQRLEAVQLAIKKLLKKFPQQ